MKTTFKIIYKKELKHLKFELIKNNYTLDYHLEVTNLRNHTYKKHIKEAKELSERFKLSLKKKNLVVKYKNFERDLTLWKKIRKANKRKNHKKNL